MTEGRPVPGPPLAGLRVLIPRGGDLGTRLAEAITSRGGLPVIAPSIEFAAPADPARLSDAYELLSSGRFNWVAVTSATTVETLLHHGVRIPATTRVAVVGPATRDAMADAGFRVDFMPGDTFSAAGMVAGWPTAQQPEAQPARPAETVLLPQSALAEPTLADGLTGLGLDVTTVTTYDTSPLDWSDDIRHRFGDGEFGAVLLTSASVARAVADQGVATPGSTVVACIGESTAAGAGRAGLPVHVVATESTAEGLVDALSRHVVSQSDHRHSLPKVNP